MSQPSQGGPSDAEVRAWETAKSRLDFEITLLWQRGAYFWTFIAAVFVAYYTVGAEAGVERRLLASLGFLLSIAWCLANMGSKYWQAVWEQKLKRAELAVTGPLYGEKPPTMSKSAILRGRRFSVSRIAVAVSALTSAAWIGILAGLLWPPATNWIVSNPCLYFIGTLLVGVILLWLTHSSDKDDSEEDT